MVIVRRDTKRQFARRWRRRIDRRGQGVGKSDLQFGWNGQRGVDGDLLAMGVIDKAKVAKTALQDAASVAGLLITMEAMIAEKPKKDTGFSWLRHGLLKGERPTTLGFDLGSVDKVG
jgi:hypothetical protein